MKATLVISIYRNVAALEAILRSLHQQTEQDFELILSPIVTEKTQNLQTNHNTMVFKVKNDATADEVKDAVEAIFAVKVDKVNIVNVSRKAKRVGQYNGHVPGYKKAYVVINKEYNLGDIARQTQETK